MMRIAICDDDRTFTEYFEKTIKSYFKKSTVKNPEIKLYNDGNDLINDSYNPDIVFLDIEMQGKNGLTVGKHLKNTNNNVIIFIITAFSQYLDDSMDIPVFRYILKPVDKQRLYNCMDNALKKYHSTVKKIVIETRSHAYTVNSSDIVMVEATEGKVIVSTKKNNTYPSKKCLIGSIPSIICLFLIPIGVLL